MTTLVIAIDGMDPDYLRRGLEADMLPTFRDLIDRGVWAPLRSTIPPMSSPALVCFRTGKNPGQSGFADFFVKKEASYELGSSGKDCGVCNSPSDSAWGFLLWTSSHSSASCWRPWREKPMGQRCQRYRFSWLPGLSALVFWVEMLLLVWGQVKEQLITKATVVIPTLICFAVVASMEAILELPGCRW